MSFLRYIASDVVVFLFAAITLPVWLPFWLWISFRNWLDDRRFWWECEQIALERERRAATSQGSSVDGEGKKG